MKTGKKSGFSQLWRRNAVVAAIALFVCAAVYLNWSYEQQQAETGKTLGESTMVDGKTGDPLLGDNKTQTGTQTGSQTGSPDQSGAQTQDGQDSNKPASAAVSSYFATARLNRQQARDSALSLLQDAASGDGDYRGGGGGNLLSFLSLPPTAWVSDCLSCRDHPSKAGDFSALRQ